MTNNALFVVKFTEKHNKFYIRSFKYDIVLHNFFSELKGESGNEIFNSW